MSDQEDFLKRWSRRKREAADEKAQPAKIDAEHVDVPADKDSHVGMPGAAAPPGPAFDVNSLPPIDSIGAGTDITAFMRPGVPSALRHAALRRAWAADPAIRDFVGLAENAWDFTNPEGMPGFGALDPKYDVKKLVAKIFGETEPDAKLPPETPTSAQATRLPDKPDMNADIPAVKAEPQQVASSENTNLSQRDEDVATQHNDSNKSIPGIKPRRHGSAIPQ